MQLGECARRQLGKEPGIFAILESHFPVLETKIGGGCDPQLWIRLLAYCYSHFHWMARARCLQQLTVAVLGAAFLLHDPQRFASLVAYNWFEPLHHTGSS